MLQVQNISFSYSEKPLLNNISFSIDAGQNVALIGESGCGKSTLLKLIYGLYDVNEGGIFWNSTEIKGPKYNLIPGMPFIKYLAQDFDLMPYTTVAENVGKFLSNAFLPLKKLRIQELLEMVEMTEFANIPAKNLSGGQQQRVALARVLALEPEILLLDEPFSHIDNFRKNALRRNLFAYLKKKKITCIIATHDSTDALAYADSTIVLKSGQIIANENSQEMYQNPVNKYVASLFGEVNELLLSDVIKIEKEKENELILLYPHQLSVTANGHLQVVCKQSYFKGNHYLIKAAYKGRALFFESKTAIENNTTVFLTTN